MELTHSIFIWTCLDLLIFLLKKSFSFLAVKTSFVAIQIRNGYLVEKIKCEFIASCKCFIPSFESRDRAVEETSVQFRFSLMFLIDFSTFIISLWEFLGQRDISIPSIRQVSGKEKVIGEFFFLKHQIKYCAMFFFHLILSFKECYKKFEILTAFTLCPHQLFKIFSAFI